MHLDHLHYFIELAYAGSFARAASALLISPQGLNKAITSLENELGVELVKRGNHGTELTPDGMLFLEYAQDATRRFDAGGREQMQLFIDAYMITFRRHYASYLKRLK